VAKRASLARSSSSVSLSFDDNGHVLCQDDRRLNQTNNPQMILEKCPHCSRDVVFLNERCPVCQQTSAPEERRAATPGQRSAADEARDLELMAIEASKNPVNGLIALACFVPSVVLAILTYGVYVQPIAKTVVTVPKTEAQPNWPVVGTSVSDPSRVAVEISYSLRNHAGLDEKLEKLADAKDALAGANPAEYSGIDRLERSLDNQRAGIVSKFNRQRDYFIGLLLATLAFGAASITFAWRALGAPRKRAVKSREQPEATA